jgi:hypothetical protein
MTDIIQKNPKFKFDRILSAFIFATGIILAGNLISNSLLKARLQDRYVTVKGLAEREIVADFAIWPIIFKATGDNLGTVNDKIELDRSTIINFLISHGFKQEELEVGSYLVTDLLADSYRTDKSEERRYIITASITLKTSNVELVKKTTQLQNLLVQKGIILGNQVYDYNGPIYEFTKFNDIKAEMLAEAIKNARKAAEQFVKDSGDTLGLLKKGNQGIFLISAADREVEGGSQSYEQGQAAQRSIRKKIRLVTTLEYYLAK